MDYAAEIISRFSNKHGQLPTSFNKLYEGREKYTKKLGNSMSSIISEASWFSDIRYVRDSLIHYGGNAIVFGEASDGVLFQIYKNGKDNLVNKKYLLFNENLAYFEKYSALYFSHLLVFLNNLGHHLLKDFPKNDGIGETRSYASGFYVIHSWIETLCKELEADEKQNSIA